MGQWVDQQTEGDLTEGSDVPEFPNAGRATRPLPLPGETNQVSWKSLDLLLRTRSARFISSLSHQQAELIVKSSH